MNFIRAIKRAKELQFLIPDKELELEKIIAKMEYHSPSFDSAPIQSTKSRQELYYEELSKAQSDLDNLVKEKEQIKRYLRQELTNNLQYTMIKRYFVDGWTYKEIGRCIGYSKSRTSTLIKQIIKDRTNNQNSTL